jgi:polyhydroxyalkanoate synthesis repressor PhaR
MSRTIKRYGNRKLYDTQESRYVTLEDISGFVKGGEDVRVVDNDSGEDLTAVTFAQIILEEERKTTGFIPLPILRRMIQQGEQALQGIVTRVDRGVEAIGAMGERAGKRVQELVESNAPGGKKLIDDILSAPQKRLESLQHRIDERVDDAVVRLKSLPTDLQRQLERIEKSIRQFEERLAKLRGGDAKGEGDETPPADDDDTQNRA